MEVCGCGIVGLGRAVGSRPRRTLGLCEVTATVLPAALICLGAFSKLSLGPNCSGAAPASTK